MLHALLLPTECHRLTAIIAYKSDFYHFTVFLYNCDNKSWVFTGPSMGTVS